MVEPIPKYRVHNKSKRIGERAQKAGKHPDHTVLRAAPDSGSAAANGVRVQKLWGPGPGGLVLHPAVAGTGVHTEGNFAACEASSRGGGAAAGSEDETEGVPGDCASGAGTSGVGGAEATRSADHADAPTGDDRAAGEG